MLRIIADIESLSDYSLVLIDELENGLHPIAVRRLVEYLISVAERKRLQVVFTTHSDYALEPLPGEAIWACLDGGLQQGKLSVEANRAITGKIDKRLAIFVEDNFVTHWLGAIIRECAFERVEQVGLYPVDGDGNAVKAQIGHRAKPSVDFRSVCYLDGDSMQREDANQGIFRMPGAMPESTVFNSVLQNLDSNIALLTIACQRPLGSQDQVRKAIISVSQTSRDPHLLFAQVGMSLGFVPEEIVRGAFLAVWIQENEKLARDIYAPIADILSAHS